MFYSDLLPSPSSFIEVLLQLAIAQWIDRSIYPPFKVVLNFVSPFLSRVYQLHYLEFKRFWGDFSSRC